jgi:hypothetical protein
MFTGDSEFSGKVNAGNGAAGLGGTAAEKEFGF